MELKGSKTEKNLETAFLKESQTANKYIYFADIAEEEGFEQIAGILRKVAENERAHAKRELQLLGGIGDTNANLKAMVEDEHHGQNEMYPEFERVANEEGFIEISDFFKRLAAIEEQHEKRFLTLLEDVQGSRVFKKDKAVVWRCSNCGWLHKDEMEAPDECPTCKLPHSGFEVVPNIDSDVYFDY